MSRSLLLSALLLLPVISAANTFTGCVTAFVNVESFSGPTTPFACATACAARNQVYRVSGYQASSTTCFCGTTSPAATVYAESFSAPATTCLAATSYSVFRLDTTYEFDRCYAQNIAAGTQRFIRLSIDECFAGCRTQLGLFVSAFDNTFFCRCANTPFPPSARGVSTSACGTGVERIYYFTHGREAAASGLTRRRRSTAKRVEDYCPGGLTACRIQGSEEGYECIDTASELESCGGCLHGEYGSRARLSRGINCATINVDEENPMTCRTGKCVAAF